MSAPERIATCLACGPKCERFREVKIAVIQEACALGKWGVAPRLVRSSADEHERAEAREGRVVGCCGGANHRRTGRS